MKSVLLPASLALCVAVTACQTTPTQPDRFASTDTNRDGRLSLDEVNLNLVTAIFKARDTNSDKRMTLAEWGTGADTEQLKAFRNRDANRDDSVTIEEALAYGRTKGMARQFMRDADTNKDGSVSRDEATVYYASKEGPLQ